MIKTQQNLVFATSNPNKVREVSKGLNEYFTFLSLQDIGCHEEVPETSDTIKGNAIQKAKYVYDHYKCNCFAEDTGLEIEALNGAPGVLTARYAGESRDAMANMNLVLENLKDKSNRKARFVTVFALVLNGEIFTFEGICEGEILESLTGEGGFGYDPIFKPKEQNLKNGKLRSFAEMSTDEKYLISHRGKALRKLVEFLQEKSIALNS